MPRQLPSSINANTNTPLAEVVHGLFNYGVYGNIISGGMIGNTTPNIYAESADQLAVIGSKMRMRNGTEFIYSKAGSATIAIASMAQAEAATSQWYDQVQTDYGWSIGDSSGTILITAGSTPGANEWAEGWLTINKGTGIGQQYQILTNTSHATLPVVTLADSNGIVTAFPAASEATVLKSNFMDTIVVATGGLTAIAVGVPLIAITANYYYWGQTKGPAPLIVDTGETVVIGMPVTHPATSAVAGAIGPCVTLENRYGYVMRVGAAAEPAIVNLDLGF